MTQTMTAAQYRRMLESPQAGKAKRPGPARRARHEVGKMNKLEAEYLRDVLEPRRIAGEISAIEFEAVKLRLADKTFYSPDFAVAADCIEIHEVKGHWEDDARVKWKATAERFHWFKFFAAMKVKGVWKIEEYGA